MDTSSEILELFRFLKEKYEDFYNQFWKMHETAIKQNILTRGHGPEHDLTVAKFCLQLTDDYKIQELSWVAALLHSVDRLGRAPRSTVRMMLSHLPYGAFWKGDQETIMNAVVNHAGRNRPDDSEVLIVLKDADRLANLAPEIVIRSGQFAPTVPSFNLKNVDSPDPSGSFGNIKTALDNIYYVLEWVMGEKFWLQPKDRWLEYSKANHWFRTEPAWPIAWHYAQILLNYVDELKGESDWLASVI